MVTKSEYASRRRGRHEEIRAALASGGVDLASFYANPSYFKKDLGGSIVALAGAHPSLLHWPIAAYEGGPGLVSALKGAASRIGEIARPARLAWIGADYWHCTVFSPVHSSDPEVIAACTVDFRDSAMTEVAKTGKYALTFTEIAVTRDGGVLALGDCSNDELDSLRERLRVILPRGHAPEAIHITLGHFLSPPPKRGIEALESYCAGFMDEDTRLGTLEVDRLAYARYEGPFLDMKIRPIEDMLFG